LSELDRDKLRVMAEQARLLARPQAAARVADAIERLVAAA
jgi:UDP-N-acetylglucosamine:LPS N-acetylglucosamine transferase